MEHIKKDSVMLSYDEFGKLRNEGFYKGYVECIIKLIDELVPMKMFLDKSELYDLIIERLKFLKNNEQMKEHK